MQQLVENVPLKLCLESRVRCADDGVNNDAGVPQSLQLLEKGRHKHHERSHHKGPNSRRTRTTEAPSRSCRASKRAANSAANTAEPHRFDFFPGRRNHRKTRRSKLGISRAFVSLLSFMTTSCTKLQRLLCQPKNSLRWLMSCANGVLKHRPLRFRPKPITVEAQWPTNDD